MSFKRGDFLKMVSGVAFCYAMPSYSDAAKKRLLKSENKPGFYVRFYKPFRPVDIMRWRLKVDGLCDKP